MPIRAVAGSRLRRLGDLPHRPEGDGNLQKIVSVAASVVTAAFNAQFSNGTSDRSEAHFDCRAFTIPDPIEVENYFIWRQQDATRNSISSLAQAHFGAKQLHGVSTSEAQELLWREKGINWNDLPTEQKRGRAAIYEDCGWGMDWETPIFTADRKYLKQRIVPCGIGVA